MTLTLLALLLLPTSLLAVVNPKEVQRVIKGLAQNPEDRYVTGFVVLFLGFFVFSFSTHEFGFEWPHLMTWMGALIALKGLVWMLFPGFVEKMVKKFNKTEMIPFYGFLRLLIILALIYIDTQVIAS
ncbi:MAG: hypothetical protein AAB802_04565 [Patescibacteria group bacterium]